MAQLKETIGVYRRWVEGLTKYTDRVKDAKDAMEQRWAMHALMGYLESAEAILKVNYPENEL